MARSFLALGSNLGDRLARLNAVVDELGGRGVRILGSGSVYETEPRDLPAQPWFLNTVVVGETDFEPEALLEVCRRIEDGFGRRREVPSGPRTIDIDIILYDDRVLQTADLTIPHPRYRERRFVLEPLAEIAPALADPVCGRTIREILGALRDPSAVTRIGPPLV